MRAMKYILMSLFVLSTKSWAVDVNGHVVYKMPSGELVNREVVLDVPPRGQGKVIWKTSSHQLESEHFRTRHVNGRVIFEVLFKNPPGAPANTMMALTGTYQRGSNGVIYYGDIYASKPRPNGGSPADPDKALDDLTAQDRWKYSAGFMFTTLDHQ